MPGDFMGKALRQVCYYGDTARVGLWFLGGAYAEYDATNMIATRAAMRQLTNEENAIIRGAMNTPNRAVWID